MAASTLHITWKLARRLVIGVIGLTVLGLGLALLVLPGPALLVIPVGLAILGLEFAWARAWLRRVRQGLSRRAIEDIGRRGSDTRLY